MSKLRSLSFLFLSISLFSLIGCETDIDIIAPQKDVTVIYGLLEEAKTQHFIRINKAFIGEESANVLAATSGVNEYSEEELQAVVIELNKQTGQETNRWVLQSTYSTDKEEGVFFSDSNKVYSFNANLNLNSLYRIECTVNVEGENTKIVSAETSLIGNGVAPVTLVKPRLANTTSEDRAELDFVSNGEYRNTYEITWQRPAGGISFTAYYRFYYTEVDLATQVRSRDSLLYTIGTKRISTSDADNTGSIDFTMNPEEFYIRMNTAFDDYNFTNPSFDRIASDTIEFFMEVADNTLATYIEVNQPSTEIAQESPDYTNVNNGIGIFASRYLASTRIKESPENVKSGRVFNSASLEELLYSNQVNSVTVLDNGEEVPDSQLTSRKGFKVAGGRCNDLTKTCR